MPRKRIASVTLASIFLSAALSVVLLGQSKTETPPAPSLEGVRALLASSDAKDQAWGAWWTSESKLKNLEPLLQKNLEAHVHGNEWQDRAVVDITLDAYIQNNSTPPPAELLESVYVNRPAQALILLSRAKSASADASVLKLLSTDATRREDVEWFAAANVMLSHRTPGFVASVMRDMRIKLSVTLCDLGSPCLASGWARPEEHSGFGGSAAPGYPPWAVYTLHFYGSVDSAVDPPLAAGPVPVAYTRKVTSGSIPQPSSGRAPRGSNPPRPSTSERFQYIRAAANAINGEVGSRLPAQVDDTRTFQWSTPAAFTADVDKAQTEIRNRYSTMMEQLRSINLVIAGEATELAVPHIDITVNDLRTVKTPLGDLGNR